MVNQRRVMQQFSYNSGLKAHVEYGREKLTFENKRCHFNWNFIQVHQQESYWIATLFVITSEMESNTAWKLDSSLFWKQKNKITTKPHRTRFSNMVIVTSNKTSTQMSNHMAVLLISWDHKKSRNHILKIGLPGQIFKASASNPTPTWKRQIFRRNSQTPPVPRRWDPSKAHLKNFPLHFFP